MSSLSKKILSAFVEVREEPADSPGAIGNTVAEPAPSMQKRDERFRSHFDQLFAEANIPGPDYFEFSKMTEAMQAIPNDQARYCAAFAGLQAQGLDKARLLSTAEEYLRILVTDGERFHATVDTAMQEKVKDRQKELDQKSERIRALTEEISNLQQQILSLQTEIRENEGKIEANTAGYASESESRKALIQADIMKIRQYIQ